MSYPENPQTTIVKNEFYPGGLSELQVWNHYQTYKNNIVNEIDNNAVGLWIFVDINTPVLKRKVMNTKFTINKSNYDKIMTGRTVSITTELKKNSDIIIIDVDPGPQKEELKLKDCVNNLMNSTLSRLSIIKRKRVISTAKGYHVYFYLNRNMDLNSIMKLTYKTLYMDFKDIYLVNKKNPPSGYINLDLTPIVYRGLHQTPYALCRNGIMSMDVTNSLSGFNRRSAIVK